MKIGYICIEVNDLNKEQLYNNLLKFIPKELIKNDEPMKNHTSFRIGGPVDIFVSPSNKEQIKYVLKLCKENNIPFYIMGNGSNLLVQDKGFRGVILQIFKNMNKVEIMEDKVWAEAGVLLSSLSNRIKDKSLTGFEFASGIPGTLGGAVFMNAGAYGGEIKQILVNVEVLDENYNEVLLNNKDLELGYRSSILQSKEFIVLSAMLKLEKGNKNEIEERINYLTKKRTTKQPLNIPSAGSTFKRPKGYYAGKLIMDSGLKGYSVGGAQVSEKHCGFIVNKGNATAKDIIELIKYVQTTVYDKYGVKMEPEIRIIGEE